MLQQQCDRAPAKARILVVDDEPAVRQLLARVLSEAGYEVTAVAEGWDGVIAASARPSYDVIVTNSFLPHLTGDQLVGYLRRLYPEQPIVHLDDLGHPIGAGVEVPPTRPEPFRVTALLSAVAGVLHQVRPERRRRARLT